MSRDDTNEEGFLKSEGRSGGEASAFETPVLVTTSTYIKTAVTGGLIALAIFLVYAVSLNLPKHPFLPLRVFASMAIGDIALSRDVVTYLAVGVGLLSALVFSLFWSALFGLFLSASRNPWTPGSIVTTAMVYGSVVWIVNFYILAPLFWPWMLPISSVHLFVGMVFFFGLPLGWWIASRTVDLQ